jgi:hypothetical protein
MSGNPAKDYFVLSPDNPLRKSLQKAFEDNNIHSVSIFDLLNHLYENEIDEAELPWNCANTPACSFLQTDADVKPIRIHTFYSYCVDTVFTCSQQCADAVLSRCLHQNDRAWQCTEPAACKYCT